MSEPGKPIFVARDAGCRIVPSASVRATASVECPTSPRRGNGTCPARARSQEVQSKLRISRVAARAILAVVLLWLGPVSAIAATSLSVLVLFSNSRLAPGNAEVDRGLRAALMDMPAPPVHLFYEFLDSPDFGGEAHERAVIEYLRAKYVSRPPDALLSFSDAAYEFVVRHRQELFPSAPLVYGSVSPATLGRAPAPPGMLGVEVEYDFAGTILQALRWHPGARRLIIVTGSSSRDRAWEDRLRREAPALSGDRQLEFWAGLPTPELLQRLAALDERSVVFTPGYYADGAGALSTPGASAARLAPASGAPVYGPLDTFIGTGVVGGRMPSFEGIGRQAGRLVGQRLLGSAGSERPASVRAPLALHVDWRQARRFGIDETAIPADAVIHFRAPTFWEQYRMLALATFAIIALQAALIAALLIERRRRRAAELMAQKQRAELAHASRLAVAGELTASIAHEINQPLGAVQASADAADLLLQAGGDRRDDLLRIVTRIRRDIMRAGDVIRRLRTLLGRHATEQRPLELGATIAETVGLMAAEASRRGVRVDFEAGRSPCRVLGDVTQIQQVLINLMLNAMDAVAEVGAERRQVEIALAESGAQVRMTVSDRGTGIAAEDLEKVFESFHSSKRGGMGLGLSIARTIVQAHGGRIWAESTPREGSRLHVELPAWHGPPASDGGAA